MEGSSSTPSGARRPCSDPRGLKAAIAASAATYEGIASGSGARNAMTPRAGRSVRVVSQASGTAIAPAMSETAAAKSTDRRTRYSVPLLASTRSAPAGSSVARTVR